MKYSVTVLASFTVDYELEADNMQYAKDLAEDLTRDLINYNKEDIENDRFDVWCCNMDKESLNIDEMEPWELVTWVDTRMLAVKDFDNAYITESVEEFLMRGFTHEEFDEFVRDGEIMHVDDQGNFGEYVEVFPKETLVYKTNYIDSEDEFGIKIQDMDPEDRIFWIDNRKLEIGDPDGAVVTETVREFLLRGFTQEEFQKVVHEGSVQHLGVFGTILEYVEVLDVLSK